MKKTFIGLLLSTSFLFGQIEGVFSNFFKFRFSKMTSRCDNNIQQITKMRFTYFFSIWRKIEYHNASLNNFKGTSYF